MLAKFAARHRAELRGVAWYRRFEFVKEFKPAPLLKNPHLMTVAASLWPRRYRGLPSATPRFFEVELETIVRADCHWQARQRSRPTLVLLHGLEGSSDSGYILGTAEKAYQAGFNVLRLNQRNCGGTEELTPTLYNSGLSCDLRAVLRELIEKDGLPELFAAGFSMGGNLVLKMAGEMGAAAPAPLSGVVAVSPSLDLAACAGALEEPRNFIYEWHFVRELKRRMLYKASLFPDRYPLDGLDAVRTVREFDEVITAKFCGFRDADDYYFRSSALRVIGYIGIPTLILTAQDDPMVPFGPFHDAALRNNRRITLIATPRGGHCAFVARDGGNERFWAEARIIEFCLERSRSAKRKAAGS